MFYPEEYHNMDIDDIDKEEYYKYISAVAIVSSVLMWNLFNSFV